MFEWGISPEPLGLITWLKACLVAKKEYFPQSHQCQAPFPRPQAPHPPHRKTLKHCNSFWAHCTWLLRSSYSTVLWACVSQLASDLTYLFGHFIALIICSHICIIKHTQSLSSLLHQHLHLLMPADEAHLCLLIAYWSLSNSPSLLYI
jgi:hypothetical protein